MAVAARLDHTQLTGWCLKRLGSEAEQVLFEAGYLSQVIGLRLTNAQSVVVKARGWQDRLVGCGEVQESLFAVGFPAARLLVPPEKLGSLGVSAEAFVPGGEQLKLADDSAARFAEALFRLVDAAPDPVTVSKLSPSPPWVGWDHSEERLWPDPDDRAGDLNAHAEDRWLDEIAAAAREQLLALDLPVTIGHGDWYGSNVRWVDRQLHAVHDWDSVIIQPEAAIAGAAAAIWPGTGLPGEVSTVRQTKDFLAGYEKASGRSWTDEETRAAWAAGLWTRAFDAKKASLEGADPEVTLSRAEATQRRRLAGL